MRLLAPSRLALAVVLAACAAPAWAGSLQLTLKDGRVTLIADSVPARQILEEWAKVGGTRVVNAEKLVGPPLTLRLEGVPEREALDVVLKSAAGFVVAPRPAGEPGSSHFDRILILATSNAPATPARSASAPGRPAPFVPPPMMGDDQFDPEQAPEPGQGQVPQLQPYPGPFPGTGTEAQPEQPQPQTSPRPGFLPVPQTTVPGSMSPLPPGYPTGIVPPVPPRKPGGGGGR